VSDAWNASTYRAFATERAQPFLDLLALVRPTRILRAVDLGCGPGELTRLAAAQLGCAEMVGIDNSPSMLAEAEQISTPNVQFERGDISSWTGEGDHDLVLANASLHWVPNHSDVVARWTAALRGGGQLAVQVPANAYMPSHTVADEVAHSEPFASAFGPDGPPPDPVAQHVLEPEEYASILYDLGFVEQHVRLQIYPHVLPSSRSVVDWVRGTTLTRCQSRLDPDTFAAFVAAYERKLLTVIGDQSPYFFPFRRILMWGRQPA
jgi:trans-aconitate 2-methyltransferase